VKGDPWAETHTQTRHHLKLSWPCRLDSSLVSSTSTHVCLKLLEESLLLFAHGFHLCTVVLSCVNDHWPLFHLSQLLLPFSLKPHW
jgi:hypothetical protein